MDEAARHYVVVDHFFAGARALRTALDKRLSGRNHPFDPARFAWEEWHVDGQFSQHRAPARSIFPADAIAAFEARLLSWARTNLGLSALGSPPWVSYVTDGGFQGLHRDTPNGEFAFTFALTRPGSPRFRGGETMIARPELLDYWRRGGDRADSADTPMFDLIPSRFNRLVAFDARVPHGVRTVEGPRAPRDGRIAIQGWIRPRGCVAERAEDANLAASRALGKVKAADLKGAAGLITFRIEKGKRVETLVDTLVATALDPAQPARAARALSVALAELAPRTIVPVVVENGQARVPSFESE